jgi:ribosome maturation factor RimP
MGCPGPFFVCATGFATNTFGCCAVNTLESLENLLDTAVRASGYHLADWEFSNHGKMLRVFIEKSLEDVDANSGVTLTDCEAASRQIQRVLEVEGIEYDRLEVSSPGLDRRLKTAADFVRFAGQRADVYLRALVDGRRHVVGIVKSVEGESVELDADGGPFRFELTNLKRARLVPRL